MERTSRRTEGAERGGGAPAVRRPVFLVGSGRSGSSFLADVLSRHPDVAYLTRLSERHPRQPAYNRALLTGLDVPVLGRILRRRFGIEEAYGFWETHAPGFAEPARDLVAGDVTERARTALRRAVGAILLSSRGRFLAKITGWSRIGYLDEVFPDALFVHLVRDGRDVANSLLRVDFWRGWQGPRNWRFGELPAQMRGVWEEHDRSFVALAGLCWCLLVNSVDAARREVDTSRFLELRYEDFVASPREELGRILEFAGLDVSSRFRRRFDVGEVRDASGKHRRDLTPEQQKILEDVTREARERYGYV